jgi:hypothetical protein
MADTDESLHAPERGAERTHVRQDPSHLNSSMYWIDLSGFQVL